jgi:hypothetical protein
MIVCINNNNNDNDTLIDNNYGRLQDLILLLKIPMRTRKDFFEVYKQFGHAPSKFRQPCSKV